MAPVLAFQTAHGPIELALLTGAPGSESVSTLRDDAAGPGQDGRLPALVEAVLSESAVALGDVGRIGVVTGPGSFTGLRLGISFARGLGLALGCPVIGVSLLDACPREPAADAPDVRVRLALQAKKRPPDITFWTQDFQGPATLSAPQELALAQVAEPGLPVLTDRPDLVVSRMAGFPAGSAIGPSAETVARRARIYAPEAAPPVPIYVRAPDAALPGGVVGGGPK